MSFAHPFWLIALALPVLLIVVQWRTHARPLALPFDHQNTLHSKWLAKLLNLVNTLPLLLLATFIILAAGPRSYERPKSKRELTNIMFCLDVSGSMNTQFGENDRYEVAMQSLNSFLNYRKGDAFSLMVFGGDNLRWVPLTTDVSAFKYAPPFLHPRKLPKWFNGGTNIGKALTQAKKYLITAETGDRMIILLSDGESSDLSNGRDLEIAQSLQDEQITLYGIHIGGDQAPASVALIASMTGGQTFTASDPTALESVFQRIDGMAQASLIRLTPDPVDHFRPWTIAALAILAIFVLTLFGLRYTPW